MSSLQDSNNEETTYCEENKTPIKRKNTNQNSKTVAPSEGSTQTNVPTKDSLLTPREKAKKRPRFCSPLFCTPKHRKTDVGPSTRILSPASIQENQEEEEIASPEFKSPTGRRRFLVPRPDSKAVDQLIGEMKQLEAPEHLINLVPKSLILNKNCVEAAFEWLLDRWKSDDEDPSLKGESLEEFYSTDQEALRLSNSFTEFEVDAEGELTVIRIVDDNSS